MRYTEIRVDSLDSKSMLGTHTNYLTCTAGAYAAHFHASTMCGSWQFFRWEVGGLVNLKLCLVRVDWRWPHRIFTGPRQCRCPHYFESCRERFQMVGQRCNWSRTIQWQTRLTPKINMNLFHVESWFMLTTLKHWGYTIQLLTTAIPRCGKFTARNCYCVHFVNCKSERTRNWHKRMRPASAWATRPIYHQTNQFGWSVAQTLDLVVSHVCEFNLSIKTLDPVHSCHRITPTVL